MRMATTGCLFAALFRLTTSRSLNATVVFNMTTSIKKKLFVEQAARERSTSRRTEQTDEKTAAPGDMNHEEGERDERNQSQILAASRELHGADKRKQRICGEYREQGPEVPTPPTERGQYNQRDDEQRRGELTKLERAWMKFEHLRFPLAVAKILRCQITDGRTREVSAVRRRAEQDSFTAQPRAII